MVLLLCYTFINYNSCNCFFMSFASFFEIIYPLLFSTFNNFSIIRFFISILSFFYFLLTDSKSSRKIIPLVETYCYLLFLLLILLRPHRLT